MTVKELIARLETLEQSTKVVVRGYVYGLDDIESVHYIKIERDTNDAHWAGKYCVDRNDEETLSEIVIYIDSGRHQDKIYRRYKCV